MKGSAEGVHKDRCGGEAGVMQAANAAPMLPAAS